MKLHRHAALAWASLAGHPLRTSLSVAGVAVGVAALAVMVSLGAGAEDRLLDRLRVLGTDVLLVQAAPARRVAGRARQAEHATALRPENADALAEECPSVLRAVPAVPATLAVRHEDASARTTVLGIRAEGFSLPGVRLRAGRAFDDDEDRQKRRVAVLGPTVARRLFGNRPAVGAEIRVGRVPFEVIGVTAARGTDANGTDQDDLVLIPLETALRRVLNVPHIRTIFVQARGGTSMKGMAREVRSSLSGRLGGPDDFVVRTPDSLLATERASARSMTALLGSVASAALALGAAGLLAVLLISVRERTREIGLRRALGARRADVCAQFLLEAGALSAAGAALGILVALGAVEAARSFGTAASFSWPAAGAGAAAALTLGLAAGVYPAVRASRLEPVDALRS